MKGQQESGKPVGISTRLTMEEVDKRVHALERDDRRVQSQVLATFLMLMQIFVLGYIFCCHQHSILPKPVSTLDLDGDGFNLLQGDCDDLDASRYPFADDICDGKDNDCNGKIDEGYTTSFLIPNGPDEKWHLISTVCAYSIYRRSTVAIHARRQHESSGF